MNNEESNGTATVAGVSASSTPSKIIDKLTPAQESLIPVYLKKWMDVGYKTEESDKIKATEAVNFMYEQILDMKTPEIHFVKSPMEAQVLCNKLVNGIDLSVTPGAKLEYFDSARGNWWLSYYSFYDYVLNVLFPEKVGEFTKFTEFLKHSENFHILWTFDNFAVVCDFPNAINLDEEKKLHSNFTGALSYRDGYAIYAQNGQVMNQAEWLKKTKKFHSSLAKEVFKKF